MCFTLYADSSWCTVVWQCQPDSQTSGDLPCVFVTECSTAGWNKHSHGQQEFEVCLCQRNDKVNVSLTVVSQCSWTSKYSGFWPVVITHFKCCCFHIPWPILIKLDETMWLGSQLCPLFCYCADHFQLRQACFCALWNETIFQSFNVFYAIETCLYFTINKPSCFLCLLRLCYTFTSGISKLSEPNRQFTLNMDSSVCDSFVSHNYEEQ